MTDPVPVDGVQPNQYGYITAITAPSTTVTATVVSGTAVSSVDPSAVVVSGRPVQIQRQLSQGVSAAIRPVRQISGRANHARHSVAPEGSPAFIMFILVLLFLVSALMWVPAISNVSAVGF